MSDEPTPITLESPAGIPLPMLWASSAIVLVVWTAMGLFHPLIELDENQALYIYSSASQVIAGVYGLTLAGYVFLRNEQNRLVDRDETLAEIFDLIQGREHDFVLLLSSISSLAILFSLLAIAFNREPGRLVHYGTMNAASALFFLSIALTTLFIVEAMRPGKIVRASDAIKDAVAAGEADERSGKSAEQAEFLDEYALVERMVDEFAANYLQKAGGNKAQGPKLPQHRVLAQMESYGVVPKGLAQEIRTLARYRNALLHGKDMTVDHWMQARLDAAKSLLEQADATLKSRA